MECVKEGEIVMTNEELIGKYTDLFLNTRVNWEPIGAYGIQCDKGWLDILDVLCSKIEQHQNNLKANNDYHWKEYGEPSYKYFRYKPVRFTQIKEKFGSLTIYYDGGDDFIEGMVNMARSWSCYVCESCGDKGNLQKGRWLRTRCGKCEVNNESV